MYVRLRPYLARILTTIYTQGVFKDCIIVVWKVIIEVGCSSYQKLYRISDNLGWLFAPYWYAPDFILFSLFVLKASFCSQRNVSQG